MTVGTTTTTPAAHRRHDQTPMAPTTGSGDLNQLAGNFSTFLTLLTTQLKNQDPTSPMDSNEFTQQLVEYSQVEQQINTNTKSAEPDHPGTTNASAITTSYLGKNVSVTNGNASLTDGAATWTYNLGTASALPSSASPNSAARPSIPAPVPPPPATTPSNWNGEDANGNQLSDGTYKLTVTATDQSGATRHHFGRQRWHRQPDRSDRFIAPCWSSATWKSAPSAVAAVSN